MSKNPGELNLPWLHCNDCHRAFENHNRLESLSDGRLQVTKSDLGFSMTSCGHFYCDNCIDQSTENGKFTCKVCKEPSNKYRVEGRVPKNLEMYIKPPISMLEDSLNFQLNNANQLIRSLRSKVSQQKELLNKAKQELTTHKTLKEKVIQIEAENEQLKKKISNFISDSQDAVNQGPHVAIKKPRIEASPMPSPVVPSIKATGRLSLKSPIIGTPPSMSRNSSSEYRGNSSHPFSGGGYPPSFQGGGDTPNMSEMWNPGYRTHPAIPSFNPMPVVNRPHPSQQYPNFGPPPPPSNNGYPPYYQLPPQQPPGPPPFNTPNQSSSAFGSPRPFYRRSNQVGADNRPPYPTGY